MTIWDICIKRPIFTVMLVSAPVVLGLVAYMRLGVDLWNRAIEAIAHRNGATVVDLFSHWAELAAHPDLVSPDGFHPSSAGYARLADRKRAPAEPPPDEKRGRKAARKKAKPAPSAGPRSGAGRARRSILPLVFKGSSASATKATGIMCSGRRCRRNSRSAGNARSAPALATR